MANYIATDTDLEAVADAIRTKGGTSAQLEFPQGFVDAIDAIETGGGQTFDEDADFCFWDYDGTPLYSYSRAEIQAMTELPPPPDHSQDDIPLSFLYWNWSLADLQAYDGVMDVGACYRPTDGKMHWFYRLTETSGLTCSFTLNTTPSVTINWGDGTGDELWGSSTDNGQSVTHTYAQPGTYHCTMLGEGRPSSALRTEGNACVVGKFVVGDNMSRAWLGTWWSGTLNNSSIETIVTNDNGTDNMIGILLSSCPYLKAYVFNPHIASISGNMLRYAYSCKIICFSNRRNSGSADYVISGLRKLKRLRLPTNFAWNRFSFCDIPIEFYSGAIHYNDLQNVYTLKRLVITGTSNTNNALSGSTNIQEIWCGLTTPPTLGGALPALKPWAIIHVPAEAVEDYKAATNWSTHADKIVGDWTANPIQ